MPRPQSQDWEFHFKEQEKSGKKQIDYCQEKGINPHTFASAKAARIKKKEGKENPLQTPDDFKKAFAEIRQERKDLDARERSLQCKIFERKRDIGEDRDAAIKQFQEKLDRWTNTNFEINEDEKMPEAV